MEEILVTGTLIRGIENPTVPRSYFRHLQQALSHARVYGPVLVTHLGRADHPELVAEVADMLLVTEGVDWTLASGWSDGGVVFSIRARERSKSRDAGEIAQSLALPLGGTAGGHGTMAAGRIDARLKDSDPIVRKLHRSFLKYLDAPKRGKSLV